METNKRMDPEEARIQAEIAAAKKRATQSMEGAPVQSDEVKTSAQLLINAIPNAVINSTLNVSKTTN